MHNITSYNVPAPAVMIMKQTTEVLYSIASVHDNPVCCGASSGRVWCVVPVAMVSVQHCNGLTTSSRPVQV